MRGERTLTGLLDWYIAAGVDEAIGDRPIDRYAESARAAAKTPTPTPEASTAGDDAPRTDARPPRPAAEPRLVARDQIERGAREIAAAATTLDELQAAFSAFDGCPLKQTANKFVFADGAPTARVMLIGAAPGGEEDRIGLPFVGPAGRLLDLMLAAIGLDRSTAYITNILPWRPPGNRNPTDAEIAACLPFTERHIELVAPDLLIPVGGTSAKTLLKAREGIMRLRGRWFNYAGPGLKSPIAARALLHPAYLLRSPAQKRETWQDLIQIRQRLDEIKPPQ